MAFGRAALAVKHELANDFIGFLVEMKVTKGGLSPDSRS